ncbi:MAG: hypothetical protein EA424_06810 [Planctomycetaceae bacterium]|nr:MAG: hypothetical protein EA424_06810 [Planctomycetaceae bacterium]
MRRGDRLGLHRRPAGNLVGSCVGASGDLCHHRRGAKFPDHLVDHRRRLVCRCAESTFARPKDSVILANQTPQAVEDTYDQPFQREQAVPQSPAQRRAVFVSDFDGTLARPDFYQLVRKHLVPRGTPDYWNEYRAGAMTHFDALKAFFAAAEGGESALLGMVDMMETPRDLSDHVHGLRALGWEIVIVSAGCSWYVQELLARAGVQLPVFANPGRIVDGRLIMERPADPAHSCWETGIDKAAVVRVFQQQTHTVAFAGDGVPDFDAARLVPAKYRFARSDLAAACREEGVPFRPFEQWTEVTAALSQERVC